MKTGSVIFAVVIAVFFIAKMVDNSADPFVSTIANLYEFAAACFGAWKFVEFVGRDK